MALSEKRQQEIMRLVREGGDELTEAMSRGKEATAEHLRKIHGEIADFLSTCADREELDFFAEHWARDGREGPIHRLIDNPHVDAGTLLRLYWYSDPEYFYSEYGSPEEADDDSERDVYVTLQRIESRITRSEYKTASIPFDPTSHVTMRGRRSEFARPIPDALYQPIPGTQAVDG